MIVSFAYCGVLPGSFCVWVKAAGRIRLWFISRLDNENWHRIIREPALSDNPYRWNYHMICVLHCFCANWKKIHWKPGRYSLPLREVTCQSWEQQALISPFVYWSPFLDVALMTDVTGFLFYLFACGDYCFPWGRRRLLQHTEVSTWLTNSLCVCSLWALGAGLITRFVSLV